MVDPRGVLRSRDDGPPIRGTAVPSRLNPYLHFTDNAREAMAFYRGVFGGELTVMTFAEGGAPHDPADADKVMHAQLETAGGETLMAADSPSDRPAGTGFSGVSMSLSGDDHDELSGWWDGLAEGATILQPLTQASWGDSFGMLVDRFGVTWFVNISGGGQAQG
jgi:PhnB protein